MKGFTKCDNGHFYSEELKRCPYCSGGNVAAVKDAVSGDAPTQIVTPKTDDGTTKIVGDILRPPAGMQSSPLTVFGDEVLKEIGGKEVSQIETRTSRKLVGWLVSYSFDSMGMDFRLYEGRNVIGRDTDCNITVHDPMMSGRHAVILFKNGRYKIKDELSSHGTWVNGSDVEDEHLELHDGDSIRMGETVFKFKSSL
jgi:hypothetical protein